MPVKINSFPITPAPIVTFEKTYSRNTLGAFAAEYSITLNGKFIAYKGNPVSSSSPASSVTMSTDAKYSTYSSEDDPVSAIADTDLLGTIMRKQEHLRNIVSIGQSTGSPLLLEVVGYDADEGIKAYCEVDGITFDDESRWTTRCGYTITLKTSKFISSTNNIFEDGSSEDAFEYYISDATDEWSIEELDTYSATSDNAYDQKRLYSVSHTASAVGKRVYGGAPPLEQAMGYVQNIIGLGQNYMPASLLSVIVGFSLYDRKLVETTNKFTGSYQAVETFTLGPQAAIETVTVNIEQDLGALSRISINGNIKGLKTADIDDDDDVDSYTNALAYWDAVKTKIYDRANEFLGGTCDLNTLPTSSSVGNNISEGVITYNYAYDNRPANFITDALTEDIQISDTYPGQIINVVPVIGRSQPIIQYINSRSEYKRSMQLSVNMPFVNCAAVKPPTGELAAIYEMYKPAGTKVYYSAPIENWNPKTGAFSYSVEWIFEGPSS
jgi:hypothetical protein